MTHAYTTYLLGGSKGIALDVAKRLASQKQPLTLIARGASELTAAAKELTQLGSPEVTTISCDLSQAENVDKLCAQIAEDTRHIQGLVNAAGYFAPKAFLDQTRADYRQYLDLNEALFLTTQAVAKNMKAHGGGSIVNIVSIAAYRGNPSVGAYSSSKAGVVALTEVTALEWGPRGIRCNLVAAGPIKTMAAKSIPGFKKFEDIWDDRAPLGWDVSDPIPVAKTVLALMSDWFPATTGEVIHVDGGFHAMGA